MNRLGFRRATHDKITGKYDEKFDSKNQSFFQEMVWKAHGCVVHLLDSRKVMSYEGLLEEIRKYSTNFDYHPNDLESGRDCGGNMPTPEQVALSLMRCVEAGFVIIEPLEE